MAEREGVAVGVSGRVSRAASVAGVVLLGVMLAGCGGGVFGSSPTPTFDLTAPKRFPGAGGAARGMLLVNEPTGISILDSDKVMVRSTSGEVSQLPNAQWSDRLPRLLQARIIQSFENANRLRAVGRPGDRLTADYQLLTDLRAFQISVGSEQLSAEVEIAAKVVGDQSGRIVAARVFRASVPITTSGTEIAALDEAFHRAVTELVVWAARSF